MSEDRIFAVMRTVLGQESVTAAIQAASVTATKSKPSVAEVSTLSKTGEQSIPAGDDSNMVIDVEESDADDETDRRPAALTMLVEAREALSHGLQLHLVTLLDESLRQSRRRRNRSANSSYGTLLQMILKQPTQNSEKHPLAEASASMAMLFGPNMKFELSQQEQAAAAELRRISKEFEEGLVADVTTDEAKEVVTGKRKLDSDVSGNYLSDKRWFEKEVIIMPFFIQYVFVLVIALYRFLDGIVAVKQSVL